MKAGAVGSTERGAVEVRVGATADLLEVQRLNAALYGFEDELGFYQNSYNLTWTYGEAGTSYFQGLLEPAGSGVVLLAEVEGRTAGYLAGSARTYAYRSRNPIAEIENMFVEEQRRGQGVGGALVQAFRDWASVRQVRRLKVGAFAANTAALRFYRSCGFADMELQLEMETS